MMEWISVKDRMPENEVRVLAIDNLSVIRVLVQNPFEGLEDWYDEEDFNRCNDGYDVTHWQPLPEPPLNYDR